MHPITRFLRLPDELISVILEYTDHKTVISCRISCRRLKDIVDDSSALQYIIELAAAGMCDGTSNGVGSAERRRRLQVIQTGWKTSAWSSIDYFPHSREMSPFMVTPSGNLVVFRDNRGYTDQLVLVRFPSESRGITERLWHLDLDHHLLGEICVDEPQDLLVFLSLPSIHVRTLSTGTVHPLTRTSGAIHSQLTCGIDLQIHENLLSVLQISGAPDLNVLVWDWKTGEHLANVPLHASVPHYSLLDRGHVMSTHMCHDSAQGIAVCFQVTTLPSVAGGACSRSYHFLLEFPNPTGPYFTQLHVNTLPSNLPGAPHSGWFHADPQSKLLALEMGISFHGPGAASTKHVVYVPQSVFLSYIAAHQALPSDVDTVMVPWAEWGPGHTRLVTAPVIFHGSFPGVYKLCGMHALDGPPILFDRGILRVTDYHPGRIARALTTQGSPFLGTMNEGPGPSGSSGPGTAKEGQEGRRQPPQRGVPPDTQIPYTVKDIPLPDGLQSENVRCMLGEDLVVLLEFSPASLETPRGWVKRMFYHPI